MPRYSEGSLLAPELSVAAQECCRPAAALLGGVAPRAGAQLPGPRLLPRARVAVQRAALDGLVDRAHELAVLGVGGLGVSALDRGLQAAEIRLDRRRVAAVLETLALGADDALLL